MTRNAVSHTSRNRGRNAAPTRPDPTRPISIGCGWSFPFKVHAKSKTYVSRPSCAIGLGAVR